MDVAAFEDVDFAWCASGFEVACRSEIVRGGVDHLRFWQRRKRFVGLLRQDIGGKFQRLLMRALVGFCREQFFDVVGKRFGADRAKRGRDGKARAQDGVFAAVELFEDESERGAVFEIDIVLEFENGVVRFARFGEHAPGRVGVTIDRFLDRPTVLVEVGGGSLDFDWFVFVEPFAVAKTLNSDRCRLPFSGWRPGPLRGWLESVRTSRRTAVMFFRSVLALMV